jgi:hypothetical protein
MRLDFNLIIVDDDWDDDDSNTEIKKLTQELELKIKSKGFVPHVTGFSSVNAANESNAKRIDLYLSDNNLGDNPTHVNPAAMNGGIAYYLQLKRQAYVCDFVLYTRSQVNEIVKNLSDDLLERQDPNLFSRFTFVSRSEGGTGWHKSILDLIDHLITKREELNNLRGLYAQQVSKIDIHLKNTYPDTVKMKLKGTINAIPNNKINNANKEFLNEVREIRNGLMHNDELLCPIRDEFCVRFRGDDGTTQYEIYESDTNTYRDKLNQAYNLVMAIQA